METEVSLACIRKAATFHILTQSYLIYVQYYCLKIYFNIILTSTTTCSKESVFLTFPQQDPLCTSALHLMCHASHIPHCSVFDQPNKIWCKMQKMKALIMQRSVAYKNVKQLNQCRISQLRNCLCGS